MIYSKVNLDLLNTRCAAAFTPAEIRCCLAVAVDRVHCQDLRGTMATDKKRKNRKAKVQQDMSEAELATTRYRRLARVLDCCCDRCIHPAQAIGRGRGHGLICRLSCRFVLLQQSREQFTSYSKRNSSDQWQHAANACSVSWQVIHSFHCCSWQRH